MGILWRDKNDFELPLNPTFFKQPVHIFCPERWLEQGHFISDAPQRPNIRLAVVGPILPDFRRGIIRSPRLSMQKPLFGHFANIHVPDLDLSFRNKYIGAFKVSVTDPFEMQSSEALQTLDQKTPDLFFVEAVADLASFDYFLEKIAVLAEFHNYALVRFVFWVYMVG